MSTSASISPAKSRYLRYTRSISALMIFFCHAFRSDTLFASLLSQSLNVGVPIFFMMSGYLLSFTKKNVSFPHWLGKRLSRLLIPYWLCVALYVPAAYYLADVFDLRALLWNIFPISGLTEDYLYEAGGHLWFVTHIAICYTFFPLIKLLAVPAQKKPVAFSTCFLLLYIIILFVLNHLIPGIICTLVASLVSFTLGYLYLDRFMDRAKFFLPFMPISIALRFVFKFLFDDTSFYTYFAALLTHQLFAVSLIALFYLSYRFIQKHFRWLEILKNPLLFLERISYEFYLTHCFFLAGALQICFFQSAAANVLVAFLLSLASAFLIHRLNKLLRKVFSRRAH